MLLIVTHDVLNLVCYHVNNSELDGCFLPLLPQVSGILGISHAADRMVGHETGEIGVAKTARITLKILKRRFHDVVQVSSKCGHFSFRSYIFQTARVAT